MKKSKKEVNQMVIQEVGSDRFEKVIIGIQVEIQRERFVESVRWVIKDREVRFIVKHGGMFYLSVMEIIINRLVEELNIDVSDFRMMNKGDGVMEIRLISIER